MTMLLVWAVISGQFVFAQHEFADRGACNATRTMVVHELEAKKAEKISAFCFDEPAT